MAVVKKKKSGKLMRALARVRKRFNSSVKTSMLAAALCSYGDAEAKLKSGFFASLFSVKNDFTAFFADTRDSICKIFTESKLKKGILARLYGLLSMRTRDIGIYMLSTGIYASTVYFIKEYVLTQLTSNVSELVFGIISIILSLFLFSGNTVAATICKNPLFSFITFDLCGADPKTVRPDIVKGKKSASVALLLGIITGLLSFLIPAAYIYYAVGTLLLTCVIFIMPETGAVVLCTFLPFLPEKQGVALCLVISASYLLKLLLKKRTFSSSPLDIAVILYAALIIFGRIIGAAPSDGSGWVYLFCVFGYFLCRNLLCKKEWLERTSIAIAASSCVASFIAVITYFFGDFNSILNGPLLADLSAGASTFFDEPAELAAYLLIASPFMLCLAISKSNENRHPDAGAHRGKGHILYFISYTVSVIAVAVTLERGAWISMAAAVVILLFAYGKITPKGVLITLVSATIFVLFSPTWLLSWLVPDTSSVLYALNVRSGALSLINDNLLGGVGIGGFVYEYPAYALPGCAGAPDAGSIYLQLLAEGGVMLLAVFAAVVLLYISSFYSYLADCSDGNINKHVYAPFASVVGILVYGLFDGLLCSPSVALAFFIVLGIGSSAICLGKKSRKYEEVSDLYLYELVSEDEDG